MDPPPNPASEGESALQFDNDTATGLHQPAGFDAKHVMPDAGSSPDLVELQQIQVDEDPKRRAVTKGWHAAFGFGIQCLSRDVSGQTRLIFPSWSL